MQVSEKQEMKSDEKWRSHHLQQGEVASAHIVKVDLDVLPPDLSMVISNKRLTLGLVVDNFDIKIFLWRLIETVVVLARKQVDPHDTENQPKDEANQQHIHNGRDGTHQGVDYHLNQTREKGYNSVRSMKLTQLMFTPQIRHYILLWHSTKILQTVTKSF